MAKRRKDLSDYFKDQINGTKEGRLVLLYFLYEDRVHKLRKLEHKVGDKIFISDAGSFRENKGVCFPVFEEVLDV